MPKPKQKEKEKEKEKDPNLTKVRNRNKKKAFVASRGKSQEFNFSFSGRFTQETCFHLQKLQKELGFQYLSRHHIVQLMMQGLLSVQVNGDEPIFGGEILFPTPDGFLNQEGEKPRMKIRKITVFLINHDANGGIANSPRIGLSFLWHQGRERGEWRMEVLL